MSWLALVWHFFTDPVHWLEILTGVVIALSVISAFRRRLCFQQFGGGDDTQSGPDPAGELRAQIRVEAHRLAQAARMPDGRPLRLDQAGPYEGNIDLGGLTDGLPPVWKPLITVIGTLVNNLGSRSRLVTGTLLPRARVVLGIETVHGGLKRMDTIKHDDFDFPEPDSPYQNQDKLGQLALPAAAWIILVGYPGAILGGTTDWRSFARFAVGYLWEQRGDLEEARRLYRLACEDPWNTAAAVNLAALEQIEEHRDGAVVPPDPLRRRSAERLEWVVRQTEARYGQGSDGSRSDLQWYRAYYLLSSDLRDITDRDQREGRLAPDHDQTVSTAADKARQSAVELALEMELRHDELPPDFVRFGRAAALTLVARQAFPSVTDGTDPVVISDNSKITDADVANVLAQLQSGQVEPGAAERLAQYVTDRCQVDDQAQYNLMRYHETRARILDAAIKRWEGVREDVRGRAARIGGLGLPFVVWNDRARDWQELLRQQRDRSLRERDRYRRQVRAAGDPVLIGHMPEAEEESNTVGLDDGLLVSIAVPDGTVAPPEDPDFLRPPPTVVEERSEGGDPGSETRRTPGSFPGASPTSFRLQSPEPPEPLPSESIWTRLARFLRIRRDRPF